MLCYLFVHKLHNKNYVTQYHNILMTARATKIIPWTKCRPATVLLC